MAISYLSISINEKCLDYWKFEIHTSWYCYGRDTLVLEMKGSKRINYGNLKIIQVGIVMDEIR